MRIPGISIFLPEFESGGKFQKGEMASKLLVLLLAISGLAAAHPRPQDEDAESK